MYFHFETITEFYKESAPSREIWILLGEDGGRRGCWCK